PLYLQAFMAWFGPKGVATMTFSLLVLADGFPRIFNLAALCVFVSILAHGLTDTPGSEWVARRAERPAPAPWGTRRPSGGDPPGGTRSASGAAGAGPPGDRGGTWRRVRRARARIGHDGRRSSPRT